jgi:hypothetical protein
MRRVHGLVAPFGAALLLLACSPGTEPQAGSESHFLETCDGQCENGLACVCGVCTELCDPQVGCSIVGQASTCVPIAERGSASVCADAASGGFCDVPCTAASDCAELGPSFFCLGGFCRVDPLSRPAEPLPGFGVLCEQKGLDCSTSQNPPNLVGNYSGQGTVVLSSNALWDAMDSDTLTVQISAQAGGSLSGTIELQSLSITVDGAQVRGDGGSFSLYASGFADVMGCTAETRILISGTLDQSASPATASGAMALRFTGNFAGTSCTPEQLSSYPETGANFLHSELREP